MAFSTAAEWVAHCRALVRKDLDNLILFTGAERSGKSTLMMQVMPRLDPSFSIDRIAFSIPDFIQSGKDTPQYGARVCDEFKANRRKAMHREILDIIEDFQTCGYRNHHIGICFPHAEKRLDGAILEDRVRWIVKTERTREGARWPGVSGHWRLFGRETRVDYRKLGPMGPAEQTVFRPVGGPWALQPNKGRLWESYLAKKDEHVRAAQRSVGAEASSGGAVLDEEEGLAYFSDLRRQYLEAAGPRSAIFEKP